MEENKLIEKIKNDSWQEMHRHAERLGVEYDRIRLENKVDVHSEYPMSFKFKTQSKNKWIIIFRKSPGCHEYKDYKSSEPSFLYYLVDNDGIFVINVNTPVSIIVYRPNFFKQYDKSMNLCIKNPTDIVKHFFLNNNEAAKFWVKSNEKTLVLSKTKEGLKLGIKREEGYTVYFDFMNKDEINESLPGYEKYVRCYAQKRIEHELIKKDFDNDEYFRLVEFLKILNQNNDLINN